MDASFHTKTGRLILVISGKTGYRLTLTGACLSIEVLPSRAIKNLTAFAAADRIVKPGITRTNCCTVASVNTLALASVLVVERKR